MRRILMIAATMAAVIGLAAFALQMAAVIGPVVGGFSASDSGLMAVGAGFGIGFLSAAALMLPQALPWR